MPTHSNITTYLVDIFHDRSAATAASLNLRLLGPALFFPWCMVLGLEGRLPFVLQCSWLRWLGWVYSGNVVVFGGV